MRTSGLALRLALGSRARILLLAALVAVSLVILLVVMELARLSSDGLDDAIAADVGLEGTFAIDLPDVTSLDTDAVTTALVGVAARSGDSAPTVTTGLPAVALDCPPFESLGTVALVIVRDVHGYAVPLPYGEGVPDESALCFDGLKIPGDGVYVPGLVEQQRWGTGLFVRPEYEPVLRSATTGPVRLSVSVVTGDAGRESALRNDAEATLAPMLARAGLGSGDGPTIMRTDHADELTSASRGVRAVYAAIGWGVVALAGVGILVSQLVIVRQRMWLFGLSRALGARWHHVLVLVLGEAALAVGLGAVGAVALGVAAGPLVSSLSQEYFGVPARLWDTGNAGAFVGALAMILVLAGALPARRALRADPLDTLEGRS